MADLERCHQVLHQLGALRGLARPVDAFEQDEGATSWGACHAATCGATTGSEAQGTSRPQGTHAMQRRASEHAGEGEQLGMLCGAALEFESVSDSCSEYSSYTDGACRSANMALTFHLASGTTSRQCLSSLKMFTHH